MLLRFPDLDTLQLAITSNMIPPEIVLSPASMGVDPADDARWVKFDATLAREQLQELKSVGVRVHRGRGKRQLTPVCCWLEGLPVSHLGPSAITVGEQTPVLFVLDDAALLPEVTGEILRLGNDRQSFRILGEAGETSALLRVVGPPYYTLLRAMGAAGESQENGTSAAVRAFVESASRVWVEVGVRHPLAKMIEPAAGEHLLIDRNGRWQTLSEQPFRDIYEVMSLALPSQPVSLVDCNADTQLTVPLHLVRGGNDEGAELWVLRKDALRQVETFVQSTSDAVLAQLAFAVVGDASDPTILVRVRPGREAPPVLVFKGMPCRTYLRIPNLFVPISVRLHPPLRRDVIKQMLAPDDRKLVWLEPDADGGFGPFAVDDGALRPLTGFVDYILDQHHVELEAWRQAHRFDFEDFICPDDRKKQVRREAATSQSAANSGAFRQAEGPNQPGKDVVEEKTRRRRPRGSGSAAPPKPDETAKLEQELSALEQSFVADEAPLDDPSRTVQWLMLAELNLRLGRLSDASICRLHELWESESPDRQSTSAWLEVELQAARRYGASLLIDEQEQDVTDLTLARLLNVKSPTPVEVTQLAACLTDAVAGGETTLVERGLGKIAQFLRRHEAMLSARSCWLAWLAVSKLSGGDALALARARDRLLERLHLHGLSPDADLPAFLRTGGGQTGQRFRIVRERVADLHEHVRTWTNTNLHLASPRTSAYIDLMFSYAAARLGESTRCHELAERAKQDLLERPDPVHGWLYHAFEFRISQALQGKPLAGPLPMSRVKKLKEVDREAKYKIERLLQHSSILDPHEALDPYRDWKTYHVGAFDRQLNDLADISDRDKLLEAIKQLFAQKQPIDERAKLVTMALDLAPRLGEKFGAKILAHVIPTDKKLDDPIARAALLENGLEIAAHFDQRGLVPQFLDRLHGLLHAQRDADVKTLAALEAVLMQSFRGLRRLGMREDLARLLDKFATTVRPADQDEAIEPERLRVLLRMAGGWFYFGEERGWEDIDRARDMLLGKTLLAEGHVGAMKQTQLAVAYTQAVGEAPLDAAFQRWQELFTELEGIHDANVVNSHYSLKILDIVEALILTMVSEGFTIDKASQRWLDEEEYLIRKRIHADVRRVT